MGDKNDAFAQYFIGQSYLAPISTTQVPVFNVTFEPGCRNNWHIHYAKSGGGQMLLCVAGRGWYQEDGKEAQELHPGDAVNIPANVKHWHGAAKDCWFQHLAIEVPGEDGKTQWCRNLLRGNYPPIRTLQTVLVLLVLLSMAGSMVSGILLSRYVFRLDVHRFSAAIRTVHILSAYWGFVFLSLHPGLHWGGILGLAKKLTKKSSKIRKWTLRSMAALIAAYGVYAFAKRDFGNYMLLRIHFVFFDFDEPPALFLLDYAAIMGLFVCVGYYLTKWIRSMGTKRRKQLSR